MRLRFLSCLLLLAVPTGAAADDLYALINRLRAGEGICATKPQLRPLQQQAALERVARDLAQGGELKRSLRESGYRAARTSALNIRGGGIGDRAAEILAGESYCQPLQEAAFTEAGIYVDDRQLWIVFAAPFAPAVAP